MLGCAFAGLALHQIGLCIRLCQSLYLALKVSAADLALATSGTAGWRGAAVSVYWLVMERGVQSVCAGIREGRVEYVSAGEGDGESVNQSPNWAGRRRKLGAKFSAI